MAELRGLQVLPHSTNWHSVKSIPERSADFAVIEHHAADETLADSVRESSQSCEVTTPHRS